MLELFDALVRGLGTVLAFFFDALFGILSAGWALGFSIILLTIGINIVVFPLTLKQTRATRAFTALQPKIKKIQAEHKDDPQEMQRQLMAAQREAGATPGGCLIPLLVQMPIWFALFRLLQTPERYIEESARLFGFLGNGATFLGMQLSKSPSTAMSEDVLLAIPYLIMIALMVATQYIQQWHSTYGQERPNQKGAGAQQAITKIMPLFIGVISWSFPAGLVLYWATSNLFRFGQQALIFKIDGRPTLPGADEASKPEKESGQNDDAPGKPQPGAVDKQRRRRRRR
ncbi:MAG: YidC/Oxa1 family membrane protein insertase [Actinobacteria bacterium]|nr:YidC/Oxa1 family membrane protein insertase [Actinomycetota bacterium]